MDRCLLSLLLRVTKQIQGTSETIFFHNGNIVEKPYSLSPQEWKGTTEDVMVEFTTLEALHIAPQEQEQHLAPNPVIGPSCGQRTSAALVAIVDWSQ